MSQYLQAAEAILQKFRKPMKARELVELALEEQILSDKIYGSTPHKTMQARLSEEIVRSGDQSVFVRTMPGTFYLRRLLGVGVTVNQRGSADVLFGVLADRAVRVSPYTAKRRMPAPANERVLTIPKAVIERLCRFQGIRRTPASYVHKIVDPKHCVYLSRIEAEDTEDHKQLVTYVMVCRDGQVLSFRRGTFNRAASFLRGSRCIGFGGHVNEDDLSIFSASDMGVSANALRELSEEIDIRADPRLDASLRFVGVVNDDSSAVGRRHLGLVYTFDVPSDCEPKKGEASINQLKWIEPGVDVVNLNEFEYWSQLCWRTYYPGLVQAQPAFSIVRRSKFLEPHVLVVLGTVGSGKSVATRYLCGKYGYHEINSGRILAKIIGLRPPPRSSRAKFQEAAWRFINRSHGPQRLAKAISSAAERLAPRKVVVDGIRQRNTLSYLREQVRPLRIATIYVHAAPDVALKFYLQREGMGRIARDAFREIYGAPVEEEVRQMITDADAVIYNWTGKRSYERTIDRLMLALKRS